MTTTTTALTIARQIAAIDFECVDLDDLDIVAADIVAADDCDSCLDCEWSVADIVEETGCDEATATSARRLYARALREMAAIHCAA